MCFGYYHLLLFSILSYWKRAKGNVVVFHPLWKFLPQHNHQIVFLSCLCNKPHLGEEDMVPTKVGEIWRIIHQEVPIQEHLLPSQLPSLPNSPVHAMYSRTTFFDCSDHRQADNYANTLKRISKYVGSEYKNGGDIPSSILSETLFTLPLPTAPTIANPANMTMQETTQMKLYEKRLDAVVNR